MRLVVFVCGVALISGPAIAEEMGVMMQAPPQPVIMQTSPRIASQGDGQLTSQQGKVAQKQVDAQLNRQVNVTQQQLQKEEARLQSQFGQLQQMRAAALEKQNKAELERIEQLEKQVVADYQKRVEKILVSAQTQIQATPIHIKGTETQQQPTKASSSKSNQSRSQSGQTKSARSQTSRSQSTARTNAQSQQQDRNSNQSKQQQNSSSRRRWFGW